ncbi:hypothetical protein [Leptonema illini]|uniref:Uncharacterized protein n=1 Tax=Leptonema illini DSM 21528 TaxID=929563 RepID=H2CEV8_9LEPT|nr:hypothetical protein [Leptonema illini]EHQ07722.1 hypothetical protein Lepil_3058 [Leptonema illini DSM 21528]
MNSTIESIYHQLGTYALAYAERLNGKLLIYAEIEEGVISADMFYHEGSRKVVRFRFCPKEIREFIKDLWKEWQKVTGNKEWNGMIFILENTNFNIEYIYPDQMIEDGGLHDRRDRVVTDHFGNADIDYSSP